MPLPNFIAEPSFTADQEDGARWSVYENPQQVSEYAIVTSSGQELLCGSELAEVETLVQQYHAVEQGLMDAADAADPAIRQELGRGQEAIVYRMGRFAVREVSGTQDVYHSLGELERMGAINGVIEERLPRWLDLPKQYVLYADPQQQKTYMLMDRIDGGLTVEDIQSYPDLSPVKSALVEREIGHELIEEAQETVSDLYEIAFKILSDEIRNKGKDPDHYLTDWKSRNVVVDRLRTPVAGSRFKLHVIDQYRA